MYNVVFGTKCMLVNLTCLEETQSMCVSLAMLQNERYETFSKKKGEQKKTKKTALSQAEGVGVSTFSFTSREYF